MNSGAILFICIILILFLIVIMNTPLREWLSISPKQFSQQNYIPRYSVKKLELKRDEQHYAGELCDPSEYQVSIKEKNGCSTY